MDSDAGPITGTPPLVPVQPMSAVEGVIRALEARPLSRAELAAELKLKSESGYFANKLISARAFGSVRAVDGRYELTELGRRLLSPERREAELAYREALSFSPAFATLQDRQDVEMSPETIRMALAQAEVAEPKIAAAQAAFTRSLDRASFATPSEKSSPATDGGGDAHIEATTTHVQPEARSPRHLGHDAFDRLMEALPAPGTRTTLAERVKWTRIFAGLLELTYPGDGVVDVSGCSEGAHPR